MKCTKVLNLAVVLSRDFLYSPQVNMHRIQTKDNLRDAQDDY